MNGLTRNFHLGSIALLLALAGCGRSEPVADIANSELIDVNSVEIDDGSVGDASAVEAMGSADAVLTAPGPADGNGAAPVVTGDKMAAPSGEATQKAPVKVPATNGDGAVSNSADGE